MKKRSLLFQSIFGRNWVTGKFLHPFLEKLGEAETGIVLDLACGESPFKQYFSKCSSYWRLDLFPSDNQVIRGNLLYLPVANNSINTILLFQALSDVPYPVEVLKEIERVLVENGKVLIFESMSYPEHDLPHDYYRILPEGLVVLAKDSGLRVEACERLGGLFTRFADLWNTFLMGRIERYVVLRPLAMLGICIANIVFYSLDRVFCHSRLASDYFAVLRK